MELRSHSYDKTADFTSVMKFLAELYEKTHSYENWFPDRFENCSEEREDGVRIWEDVNDTETKIVAITSRDSPKDYFLSVDPEYHTVEGEMIRWIDSHYYSSKTDKSSKLHINILEGNSRREKLLTEMNFIKKGIYGYYRIRKGSSPKPKFPCPKGFTIRPIRKDEYVQQTLNIRKVFGHGESFTADVLEWISNCSFYHKELDLVAVNPDGIIASFCTFRVDPTSSIISLEPMGTHPDFRKLGLGKALMTEGIRRSMKFNPPFFYIDGAANTPAANRLYDITGFDEKYAINSWIK